MADEKLIAPKHRRLAAFIADAILVFLLWYLMTMKDLGRVDTLLESLDPLTERAGSACGIDLQDGDGFSSKMAVLPEPLFLYSSCRFGKRENRGKAAFPAQPAGCDKPRRNVAEQAGSAGICGKNAVGDSLGTSRNR